MVPEVPMISAIANKSRDDEEEEEELKFQIPVAVSNSKM